MEMGDSSHNVLPFTILKTFHQGIKIPTKNWRLCLFLLLLSLLSSSLLFLTNYLSISPYLLNLSVDLYVMRTAELNSPEHSALLSAVKNDTETLAIIEFIFFVLSFFISSFLQMATMHASAFVYFARNLSVDELLAKLRKSWKMPFIIQFYVATLNLCCVFMLMVLIGFFVLVDNGSIVLFICGAIFALLAIYKYINLLAVWLMSVVVSVVEEGCYGIEAMGRAMELINRRRRQAFLITLLWMVSSSAYYGAYAFSTAFVPPVTANPLANSLIIINISVLLNMFVLVVYTMFYCECRGNHGEEEIAMKGGPLYGSLPATSIRTLDAAFPRKNLEDG